MKRLRDYLRGHDLRPRQIVFLTMVLMAIVAAWALESLILPAYRELIVARSFSRSEATQYVQLAANLSIRQDIDAAFARLDHRLIQTDSDSITLSEFLRALEQARARYPEMRIVNVKPLRVQDAGPCRLYHVKLAVAAKIQDVLQFVADLTGGGDAVGVDAFSLRGVQGLNVVECTLSLNLVRLVQQGKAAVKSRGAVGHKENTDAL